MPLILTLALQAATVSPASASSSAGNPARATPAAVPQRFSILTDPCASGAHDGEDIIVCGQPEVIAPRLPYPDEVVPNHPMPSNPELSGTGAVNASATPCAVSSKGCVVGFGPPIAPILAGAVDLAKTAFARRPDKRGRVAIPLDDPHPGPDSLQP